ncbi:MAG: GIY-YIG nuclease family protein [Planctomycetes bacterium]|nr:GIY-YIG nuclease family protein [Planctomycetota bacterium]
MVMTFNALLRGAGIDPAGVLLLRHRDPRVQRQVYETAIHADARFDDYQRHQIAPRVIASFDKAAHLAGFVVDHAGDSVFAGVWSLHGRAKDLRTVPFAGLGEQEVPGATFDTRRVDALDQYRGRLVIEWGDGQRAWVQRAHLRTKPIAEIRRQISEPVFPGFLRFTSRLSDVEVLPSTWIAALRSTGGVYLLVHRERAHLYVGSAAGGEGFFGRWRTYQNGHGGNVGMQEIEGRAEDYDVSILETAGTGLEERDVLRLEASWKQKLASRQHGLNRN